MAPRNDRYSRHPVVPLRHELSMTVDASNDRSRRLAAIVVFATAGVAGGRRAGVRRRWRRVPVRFENADVSLTR